MFSRNGCKQSRSTPTKVLWIQRKLTRQLFGRALNTISLSWSSPNMGGCMLSGDGIMLLGIMPQGFQMLYDVSHPFDKVWWHASSNQPFLDGCLNAKRYASNVLLFDWIHLSFEEDYNLLRHSSNHPFNASCVEQDKICQTILVQYQIGAPQLFWEILQECIPFLWYLLRWRLGTQVSSLYFLRWKTVPALQSSRWRKIRNHVW